MSPLRVGCASCLVTFICSPLSRVQPFPSRSMRLHLVLWLLLTSHDKSYFNRAGCKCFPLVRETSHGKTSIFHSMSPQHLHALRPCRLLGFVLFGKLIPLTCLMMFVFLWAGLCIRLPLDSSSRWTPLPSASGWQRPAPIVDFHNLDISHAWRTKTKRLSHLTTQSLLSLLSEGKGFEPLRGCPQTVFKTAPL